MSDLRIMIVVITLFAIFVGGLGTFLILFGIQPILSLFEYFSSVKNKSYVKIKHQDNTPQFDPHLTISIGNTLCEWSISIACLDGPLNTMRPG